MCPQTLRFVQQAELKTEPIQAQADYWLPDRGSRTSLNPMAIACVSPAIPALTNQTDECLALTLMQIFPLANICRNRINYRLLGWWAFVLLQLTTQLGFQVTGTAGQPPYAPTYPTLLMEHFNFPLFALFSGPAEQRARGHMCFALSWWRNTHTVRLQHSRPSPTGTAARTITILSAWPVDVRAWNCCMKEDSGVGAAQRAVGQHKTKPSDTQEHTRDLHN